MAKKVVGAQLYTVREFTKTIGGVADTLKKVADIGALVLWTPRRSPSWSKTMVSPSPPPI